MGANNNSLPAINEIAHFLREFVPSQAAALSEKGALYRELLTVGVYGGDEEAPDADARDRGLAARCDILGVALSAASGKADRQIKELQQRLGRARWWRLAAMICSGVGSLGTVLSAAFGQHVMTIVLGVFSFSANAANAVSTMLLLHGKKESQIVDEFRKLTGATEFARLTAARLSASARDGLSEKETTAMLKQANGEYRNLNLALANSIV